MASQVCLRLTRCSWSVFGDFFSFFRSTVGWRWLLSLSIVAEQVWFGFACSLDNCNAVSWSYWALDLLRVSLGVQDWTRVEYVDELMWVSIGQGLDCVWSCDQCVWFEDQQDARFGDWLCKVQFAIVTCFVRDVDYCSQGMIWTRAYYMRWHLSLQWERTNGKIYSFAVEESLKLKLKGSLWSDFKLDQGQGYVWVWIWSYFLSLEWGG